MSERYVAMEIDWCSCIDDSPYVAAAQGVTQREASP